MKTKEEREVFIYVLKCPITLEVRYVGKSVNPKRRFSQHTNTKILKKNKHTRLSRWILKLKKDNKLPIIEIIDTAFGNWAKKEQFYISLYKRKGSPICNITEGGEGTHGRTCKEETKQKIRATLKGVKHTRARRQNVSKAMTGTKRPQFKEVISEIMKKRYSDPIEREKHRVLCCKQVVKLNSNGDILGTYYSVSAAAKDTNVTPSYITKCCKGHKKLAKGFIFKYA